MAALAVLSVIIAGIRMAWENRADPGKDLIKSLFTLLVVAGAGVTFTQLFITASDTFSVWLLQGSLKCDVATDKACFGKNITTLLALGANPATGGSLGAMLVIILGIIASLAAFVQIVLMVARSGMLVILAGILPLSAAATNTEMGKGWFRKCLGWLIAFLLYKPAAAIVYAAAFQLVGSNIFADDDALVSILTGSDADDLGGAGDAGADAVRDPAGGFAGQRGGGRRARGRRDGGAADAVRPRLGRLLGWRVRLASPAAALRPSRQGATSTGSSSGTGGARVERKQRFERPDPAPTAPVGHRAATGAARRAHRARAAAAHPALPRPARAAAGRRRPRRQPRAAAPPRVPRAARQPVRVGERRPRAPRAVRSAWRPPRGRPRSPK